jgi:hypothetical protein
VYRSLTRASNLVPTGPSFDQEDAEDPEYVVSDSEYYNDNTGVMSLSTI